jgi:hypothetical protein
VVDVMTVAFASAENRYLWPHPLCCSWDPMDRPASPAAAAPVVLQAAEAVLRAYWVDGLFWDNEIPAELELSSSVPYDHPAAVTRKWFTARYRDPRVEADYKRFLYLRVAANRWAPMAFLYFALVLAAMAAAYQDVVIGIGAGIIIVGAISIVARRQYIAAVVARLAPHEAAAEMSHSPLPYVDAATFNAQTATIHHTQIFARIEQRLEAQATISDEVEIFYAVVVVLTWLLSAYHATHVNRNACDGHMENYWQRCVHPRCRRSHRGRRLVVDAHVRTRAAVVRVTSGHRRRVLLQ